MGREDHAGLSGAADRRHDPQRWAREPSEGVELELVESAARTRELKYWLKDQGYFTEAANRVIYKMRQRDEELVVVEGRVTMSTREQDVGIITTFRNDTSGDHSLQSAIDLYNITFCSLVLVNADEEALDAAKPQSPRPFMVRSFEARPSEPHTSISSSYRFHASCRAGQQGDAFCDLGQDWIYAEGVPINNTLSLSRCVSTVAGRCAHVRPTRLNLWSRDMNSIGWGR